MPQLPRVDISINELRERLDYDPATGVLRWRKGRKQIAGHVKPSGYREIEWVTRELGKRKGRKSIYPLAHRMAWAMTTGTWPENEIDHRNGNRDDNRLVNLRPATRAENAQNLVQEPRFGAPLVGVSRVPRCINRWRAGMHGRYLGTFGSPEEASRAYFAAKAQVHSFQPQPRE